MPRVADSGSWSLDNLSRTMWSFFNVAYLYFRTLLDPLLSIGNGSQSSRSRSSYGTGGPPRPPRRGGFATFSDTIGSAGNLPPPPGG